MPQELTGTRYGGDCVHAPLVMDLCREWLTMAEPTPRAVEARLLALLESPKYAADPVGALCSALVAACELWIHGTAETMAAEGEWHG